MSAYYNEIDQYAAQWLRNLIAEGHIADGEVDERSIAEVRAEDLKGFTQCHFFAGIGVWSHALRLAGWADDRPVWTGSCPCQPFSSAGKGAGTADERHLWPVWFNLIRERRPEVIFGEQVEAAVNHGWLDLVQSDLEREGYACGTVGLPACSVGAPHIRQRLWFVGCNMDDPKSVRWGLFNTENFGKADAPRNIFTNSSNCSFNRKEQPSKEPTSQTKGHWRDADWLFCRDGRLRAVEPGTFPLAHGAASRVGRLRAYGNAIVPQVAAEVISTFMEYAP